MEALNKSLDELIDLILADGEEYHLGKSMIKDEKPQKETADEAVNAVPKSENDESRGAGRPKQISDVPQKDIDGERQGEYDGTIAQKNEEATKKEDSQVAPPAHLKKSLTDEQFAEYEALKKAKADAEAAEILAKARKEQSDLIKSAIVEATASLKSENEQLRKSLEEQGELIRAIANKPQKSKAVTNVQAVEKFEKSQANVWSKAEMLDVAEELVKSRKLEMEHVIELEDTGYIFDQAARKVLENEMKKRS